MAYDILNKGGLVSSAYVNSGDQTLPLGSGRKAAARAHDLPAPLPAGEHIVWQSAPRWQAFAAQVFRTRLITFYFALLAIWRAIVTIEEGGQLADVALSVFVVLAAGGITVGLLSALAWFAARGTTYTITNRRIVMRIGAALSKTIDLPFKAIDSVQVRAGSNGVGNIALKLRDGPTIPYLIMWPHVRPWRFRYPQPMLRAVPDIDEVSRLLGTRLKAAAQIENDKDLAADDQAAKTEAGAPPVRKVQNLPRVPLLAAASLAVLTLVIVAWVQLTGSGPDPAAARSPETVYNINVRDLGDDRLALVNAQLGETITTAEPGRDSLILNALRGLEQAREARGLAPDAPYQLVIWDTGRVTLSDLEMDQHVPLDSFRPMHDGALEDLLNLRDEGS